MPSYRRGRPETNFVFPFSLTVLKRGTAHLPMVSVALSWKAPPASGAMLMDTGAESSFLTPDMATFLGLEVGPGERWVYPIGERFMVRESRVRIQLIAPDGGRSLPRILEVLVPSEPGILETPILGMKPFLDWYELTVRGYKQEFVLREVMPPPKAGEKVQRT